MLKRLAKSAYWNTTIFSVHFGNVNAISRLKMKSAENKSASFEIYFSLYEDGGGGERECYAFRIIHYVVNSSYASHFQIGTIFKCAHH